VSDSEKTPASDHSAKVFIQPRLSNHQTQNKPAEKESDYAALISQLKHVLEDFRGEKPSHEELSQFVRDIPRIRQSGQLPLKPETHSGKRRRRRRGSPKDQKVSEFEKYLPGSRRRQARRKKLILVIAAVALAFVASNYATAKFFYNSGVSEGMARGLSAQSQTVKPIPGSKESKSALEDQSSQQNPKSTKPNTTP
jgi:hypothetical protein